ncbi:Hypothetical protein GLP15_2346 [Giardia lamblia P15]|uniref:Uncharacterized protein n=1 Tax=Giardia intestinalis (strain P15) TaxID=658858 RepID=E1F4X2_GIAIA|nr:Hypothetical protein GLP15_2346 [Giardia lamblia P15]
MKPTGLFDVAEQPTLQGNQGRRAATVLSYSLYGDNSGLVASFFRVIHQALALQQIEIESLPISQTERESTSFKQWVPLLTRALQQEVSDIGISSLVDNFFSAENEQDSVSALLKSLPPTIYNCLFAHPSKCTTCGNTTNIEPFLFLAEGESIESRLQRATNCSVCGTSSTVSASAKLMQCICLPRGYSHSIPMKPPSSPSVLLGAVITVSNGYYLCTFINPHIITGQTANIVKDRYFLLYAPHDSPLRSMPGSRAAELTYLKYRKVKRYIDSPASSSEATLLGLPVYAIYFNISALTSTVRDHLYAMFTEEPQPVQAEHTVPSSTESVPKVLAPEPLSIFEIPVINLQDRYSFSRYEEESSEKPAAVEKAIVASPSISIPPLQQPEVTYVSTQRYCQDCRDHWIIYLLLASLSLAIIVLFVLVIRFYLKFNNLTVTNLLVTRRAFLGFSDWNSPDIPRDQLLSNDTSSNSTVQNYTLVTTRGLSSWTVTDNLIGNGAFQAKDNKGITIQELHANEANFSSLKVQNLLFNRSLNPGATATSTRLWIHDLQTDLATTGDILTTTNLTVTNDITTEASTLPLDVSKTITTNILSQLSALTISSPTGYHKTISGLTALAIPNGQLTFSATSSIKDLDLITGYFQFTGKTTITTMISKNLIVNLLDLGKMDSRSNITVTSLSVGDIKLDSNGVTSGSSSFSIKPTASGTPPSTLTLTGDLGQGALTVQQSTTAAGCTCGAAPNRRMSVQSS